MKKLLSVLLALAMTCTLAACQSPAPASSSAAEQPAVDSAPSSEAPGSSAEAPDGAVITLKLGNQQASSHSSVQAFHRFKESVEEASGGRIQCEIYSDALLGDENAMQEMMTMGTLDMMYSGNLPSYIPLLGALELPYLYEDREHILAFYESDAFKELMKPLEAHNMTVIAAFENGFRQITNDKKPINSAADLQGMLFRTAATPGEIYAFEAAGAIATTITYTELYSALQQGIVDGQENPIQNIYNAKFYEVQDHLAVTNHIYNSGFIVIRKDLYDTMPEDLKEIVNTCITEAQDWQIQYVADNDSKMLAEIEAYGVAITYPDLAEMEEAMSGAYEMMYAEYGDEARDLVEAIRAAKP